MSTYPAEQACQREAVFLLVKRYYRDGGTHYRFCQGKGFPEVSQAIGLDGTDGRNVPPKMGLEPFVYRNNGLSRIDHPTRINHLRDSCLRTRALPNSSDFSCRNLFKEKYLFFSST